MKTTLLAAGLAFAMLATPPAARAAEGDIAVEMFANILKTDTMTEAELQQTLAGFYVAEDQCGSFKLNHRVLDRVVDEFVGPGNRDEFEKQKAMIGLGWINVSPHQRKVACEGVVAMSRASKMLAK